MDGYGITSVASWDSASALIQGHFKLPLEFYQEFSKRVMATKQCWAGTWTKSAAV